MTLALNVTLAILAVIWLSTIFLAFVIARTDKLETGKLWSLRVAMLVLLAIAILLASDRWFFDIL